MKAILLDTHVWIWFAEGSKILTPKFRQLINDALQDLDVHISAISVWEVCMLEKKKRIQLEMPCLEWVNRSIKILRVNLVSPTPSILFDSCNLPGSFHDDPADRMIVSTARIENLSLFTRDEKILKYSKGGYVSTFKV